MDLKRTLNLPDAQFAIPMKADMPKREPAIQAEWDRIGLYHLTQEARQDAPVFVLHDGPPYTNGPVHIGTALNKILKDFVVKSHTLMGYRAPYVPGFDCHGLPIEQAVLKKLHDKGEKPDLATLRKACRLHSQHYIEVQTEQFRRLGVLGLWENPYTSMRFAYEAEIVRIFRRLVERGYVYRGLRPVLWSPTSETALADTEIVYEEHTSQSIYVKFPLRKDPKRLFEGFGLVSTVIWTTTPWTIPANLAVAYHPDLDYVLVQEGDEHFLVLESLVPAIAQKVAWHRPKIVKRFRGVELEGAEFSHPIFDRPSIAVLARYVTTEDGTGVVHTAPGHGREDFQTGKEYGLPVLCPVDSRGYLTEEAGEFAGVRYNQCDTVVVERLREVGALLHDEPHIHSYPYAERDGKPVIFRATEQWFINVDHEGLREKMLGEIEDVKWVPPSGYGRIRAMVGNRPDWCISRQRPWGVGIPVFYGAESGEPVLDPVAIEAVAALVEKEGSDAWYAVDAADILPKGYVHPTTGETTFRKETDVFDVWFDSGCTSLCVLEGKVDPAWKEHWPADLFLEGSDQHRGWFNVSLVIGTGVRDSAPYRQVVTHGMVVDEAGKKMSKRFGNAIEPVKACEQYGADIVRLWVASVDYEEDVPCSDALLRQTGETYRRIRNTLRFLMMNLFDYEPAAPAEPQPIDRFVVDEAKLLAQECLQDYREYRFTQVANKLHTFCASTLSAFYLDLIKDRMYCDGANWPSRRGAQWACHEVLVLLTKLMAPVLAHTAEEVYAKIPAIERLASVHLESIPPLSDEEVERLRTAPMRKKVAHLHAVRDAVAQQFAAFIADKPEKDPQDYELDLSLNQNLVESLQGFGEELPTIFRHAAVRLEPNPNKAEREAEARFELSRLPKSDRSRIRRPDVEECQWEGEIVWLSKRDQRAMGI